MQMSSERIFNETVWCVSLLIAVVKFFKSLQNFWRKIQMLLIKGGMLQQIFKEHPAVWYSMNTHKLASSTLYKRFTYNFC